MNLSENINKVRKIMGVSQLYLGEEDSLKNRMSKDSILQMMRKHGPTLTIELLGGHSNIKDKFKPVEGSDIIESGVEFLNTIYPAKVYPDVINNKEPGPYIYLKSHRQDIIRYDTINNIVYILFEVWENLKFLLSLDDDDARQVVSTWLNKYYNITVKKSPIFNTILVLPRYYL